MTKPAYLLHGWYRSSRGVAVHAKLTANTHTAIADRLKIVSKHQLLWWTLVVAGGLAGVTAAVNSSSILSTAIVFAVTAPILGLLFTTLRSLDSNGERVRPITATTVARNGAITGFMLVAFYGLTDLIGKSVFPLILLLALTSPMVMDRWRTRPARSSPNN